MEVLGKKRWPPAFEIDAAPKTDQLFAVWGADANHVYAGALSGTVYFFNGTVWGTATTALWISLAASEIRMIHVHLRLNFSSIVADRPQTNVAL